MPTLCLAQIFEFASHTRSRETLTVDPSSFLSLSLSQKKMVMNSGLISSPRIEAFPAGLRVLVVDDDPTWLKILEKMLKKCSYDVTTCGLAREALRLLRDRKDGFDIVISDVNMPDMDGFKLLEHVGLEMDLPVIMMSVDGETSRVMKGVQHGACDYLLKPIRMKELKNIWQHVLRKRMHEVRDIECFEDRNGPDNFDGLYCGDQTFLKKRKDVENKHDEKGLSDPSTKKARVVWTVELQQKFLNAVNQMGIDSDKVGPKKILDLMNVPGLTRENVASHLQKYRLYLNRIRKEEKTESSFRGTKNSDYSPNGSCGLQNPTFGLQNDVSGNYGFPGTQLPVQADAKPLDADVKSSDLFPSAEQRKPSKSNSENSDPHKVSSSQVGLSHTLGSLETSINFSSFDSHVAGRYPWTAETPEMQFETEFKEHPNFVQAGLLEPAPHIKPGPSISESSNLGGLIDIKPLNVNNKGGNYIRQFSPTPIEQELESFPVYPEAFGCGFDMPLGVKNHYSREGGPNGIKEQVPSERLIQSFPLHSQSHTSNLLASETNFNVTLDMKGQGSSEGNIIGVEPEFRNPVLKSEPSLELLDEELLFRWLQGCDGPSKDVGFDYLGFPYFNFADHIGEVSMQPYVGKSVIDYEYPFDSFEHPFVDQGILFS